MPTNYKALDALILSTVTATPQSFASIFAHIEIHATCKVIAEEAGTARSPFGVEPFRVPDRRLQALRKKGDVRSTTKGWVLADATGARP